MAYTEADTRAKPKLDDYEEEKKETHHGYTGKGLYR